MKYRIFSAPGIMAYCLLVNVPFMLLGIFIPPWVFLFGLLFCLLPLDVLVICVYRNAFSLVTIDETGIHTKKCSLRWEEIDRFQLYRIEGSAYRRMECFGFSPILGLGDPQEGRFENQDNTRVILLTPTRKTMEKIRRCCKNPNKTVQQLIVRYSILAK